MAQVIMSSIPGINGKLDNSVRSKAFAFLGKLGENHKSPGLHVEPIVGSADTRVRTGRVDKFWRAVLFQIPHKGKDPWFVYAGTFPHDDAIDIAKRVTLHENPVQGMAELSLAPPSQDPAFSEPDWREASWAQPENWMKGPDKPETGAADGSSLEEASGEESAFEESARAPSSPAQSVPDESPTKKSPAKKPPAKTPQAKRFTSSGPQYAVMGSRGLGLEDLVGLGLARSFAESAMAARSDDEIVELCEQPPAGWQGDALLELATGTPLEEVRAKVASWGEETEELSGPLEEEEVPETPEEEEDQSLRRALMHPAARMDFNFIETDEDLRAAIDNPDFNKWRVFLHPEQRRYVMRKRNGAFRLSGGAGTGKTVVLLHRAKRLATADPEARIVLTTFGRTLADSLGEGLETLDPHLPRAEKLGEPGVLVAGVDQLTHAVLSPSFAAFQKGTGPQGRALEQVLGVPQADIRRVTQDWRAWDQAMAQVPDLPDHLRTTAFMEAEYNLVILPRKITSFRDYARVARRGRKVPLSRKQRRGVWDVVEQYRAACRVDGSTSFAERAMLAATLLEEQVRDGISRPADHVLVDESQDLNPPQLRFLRALVREGADDLFLAEDAHQRIYAHPVTLSHHDINIRGRSRRLKLNYRTTAQNLTYAVNLLMGGNVAGEDADGEELVFEDLEGSHTEFEGLRSARSGPVPRVIETSSLTARFDEAASTIDAWLEEDIPASSVGVLCHSNRDAGRVVGALLERGVPATHVSRSSAPANGAQARNVQVLTMHRAKGMEFERVILFGLQEEPYEDKAQKKVDAGAGELSVEELADRKRAHEIERLERRTQHRALIYVAASRARDEVVVLAGR